MVLIFFIYFFKFFLDNVFGNYRLKKITALTETHLSHACGCVLLGVEAAVSLSQKA